MSIKFHSLFFPSQPPINHFMLHFSITYSNHSLKKMASLLKEMPSLATLLSFYASFSAFAMLIRTILNEMIPNRMRDFIKTKFSDFFSNHFSSDFTFVIEDGWQGLNNETYRAVEVYLPTKVGPSTRSLLLGNNDGKNIVAPPKPGIVVDTQVVDFFKSMRFEWTLRQKETKKYYSRYKRSFELKCSKKDRDEVLESYLPHICKTAQSILNQRDSLNIYSYDTASSYWECTLFKHPATFDTLALDPELKQSIIDDLDLFLNRKEYFQTVGRAWKRGYLLYGPPGTGKSSLVAAIANYLRFHIYDLQLQCVRNDSDLRRILTSTTNRSILLIEDIDCSTKSTRSRVKGLNSSEDDDEEEEKDQPETKLPFDPGVTLSGLLNFIDGLWSSCGDERIIIFTTNHKDKLDPALLRPGRMDVHIYMGHCTAAGFEKLAATYLQIQDHVLYKCIEEMIQRVPVTPAELAQQLMRSDKALVSLEGVIEFLSMKETEAAKNEVKKEEEEVIKKEVVKCGKDGVKVKQGKKKKKNETELRDVYLT